MGKTIEVSNELFQEIVDFHESSKCGTISKTTKLDFVAKKISSLSGRWMKQIFSTRHGRKLFLEVYINLRVVRKDVAKIQDTQGNSLSTHTLFKQKGIIWVETKMHVWHG